MNYLPFVAESAAVVIVCGCMLPGMYYAYILVHGAGLYCVTAIGILRLLSETERWAS